MGGVDLCNHKLNYYYMKNIKYLLFSIIIISIVLGGCHKDDTSLNNDNITDVIYSDSFYDDTYILKENNNIISELSKRSNSHPLIDTIKYVVDYQNQLEKFIDNVKEDFGYPVWSYSLVETENADGYSSVIVPLVFENSLSTESVLLITRYNDKLDIKLLMRNRLYNSILKDKVDKDHYVEIMSFIHFDEKLFRYIDPNFQRIYHQANNSNLESQELESRNDQLFVCVCFPLPNMVFREVNEIETRGGCYWVCYPAPGGSGSGGSGSGGSGSGGSGTGGSGTGGSNGEGHGWGSTSGVGGGSGGGSGGGLGPDGPSDYDGGHNPLNWWEENEEDDLLTELIIDLDLDEEDAECLKNAPLLEAKIFAFKNSDSSPLCTDKTKEEILKEAIRNFCDCKNSGECDGKAQSEKMDEVMDSYDWIDESGLNECSNRINCLYNKVMSMNTDFVCDYLSPIQDDENVKMEISFGETPNPVTFLEDGVINLQFPNDYCNNTDLSDISIVSKLMHEFVHVELMREMINSGLDANNFNDWYNFFPELANYMYEKALEQGVDEVHHHLMIEYENIIDNLAEALFNMFAGSQHNLTIDHFKMAAANGLFGAMEIHASDSEEFNSLYGQFTNNYSELSEDLNDLNLGLGCQ